MHNLDDLIHLQHEQLRHDKVAHSEILGLPMQRRITHMVLHFAKYTGALSQQLSDERFQQILIDALIIALASANSLNVSLPKRIADETGARSCSELARITSISSDNVKQKVFLGLASATGVMAKACESLDHLETYDFRGTLERQVTQVACLALAGVSALQMNFASMVRARWKGLEEKSIFSTFDESQNVEAVSTPVALVKTGSR